MSAETIQVPEGIVADITTAIKRKIFFSLIPKDQIKDAIILAVENVEDVAQRIVRETGLSVRNWVSAHIDDIIAQIAAYIGIMAVPEMCDSNGQPHYAATEPLDFVPEAAVNVTLLLTVAQFVIPILKAIFN